jgi:hypothetical protein
MTRLVPCFTEQPGWQSRAVFGPFEERLTGTCGRIARQVSLMPEIAKRGLMPARD